MKLEAQNRGLAVLEANKITPEVLDQIKAARPDVICVAAYGCILPDSVLEVAPLGCVNVHASLLPRWRGAAPIQRAVLEGDERAGISIMEVVHELDAGAYCAQASVEVGDKTSSEIMAELGLIGGKALCDALLQIEAGTAVWQEQDESQVTYAHKIDKAEMRPAPEDSALINKRRIQASTDAQPARAVVAGKGVRLVRAALADASDTPEAASLAQGAVLVNHGRVFLGCSDAAFEVLEVKPDGKRQMSARDWAAGLRAESLSWQQA